MAGTRWLITVMVLVLAVAVLGCVKGTQPKSTGSDTAGTGGQPPAGAVGEPSDRTVTPEGKPGESGTPAGTQAAKWTGTAQDFEAKGFDGKTFKISDYAGQPVVLNFWAAWCPPCVGEFPDFQAIYDQKKGQFVMISIAVDAEQDPEKFVKDKGYTWIFAHDTDGGKKYNIDVIPQTFFISSSGEIIDSQKGGMDASTFESKLAKLLGQ